MLALKNAHSEAIIQFIPVISGPNGGTEFLICSLKFLLFLLVQRILSKFIYIYICNDICFVAK